MFGSVYQGTIQKGEAYDKNPSCKDFDVMLSNNISMFFQVGKPSTPKDDPNGLGRSWVGSVVTGT